MVASEFSNGFSLSFGTKVNLIEKVAAQQSRRGNVTRFSSKSCQRLRHLLLRLHRPADKVTCAITLTIPCKIDPDSWRALMMRFNVAMIRCKIGMVWRVELQRRKVPHLHCVAICDTIDDIGDIWHAWVKSCDSVYEGNLPVDGGYLCLPVSCHAGFLVYGFSCRIIRSDSGWFSYVAGHSVKHKSIQLGWQGRQWGIFNKSKLDFVSATETTVDDRFLIFLCRCIRKRWRFSRVNIMSKGTFDFFVSPSFMIKARSWFYRDVPI